jgi:hypothetical protein
MNISRLHFAPEIHVALSHVASHNRGNGINFSNIPHLDSTSESLGFEPHSGWQVDIEALVHNGKSTSPWLSDIPERHLTPRVAKLT